MSQKHKVVKMPIEAYELFKNRKLKMEQALQNLTGRKISVKMVNVYRLSAKMPIEIPHELLVKTAKNRGVRL